MQFIYSFNLINDHFHLPFILLEHSINFDEQSGRLRLADFLYTEYSLEEVIYQLAKVLYKLQYNCGYNFERFKSLMFITRFLPI